MEPKDFSDCVFFVCKVLFLCLCAFYTTIFHVQGKFSLAYCAHYMFLLFLGAKIMANPKTKKAKWPTTWQFLMRGNNIVACEFESRKRPLQTIEVHIDSWPYGSQVR